MPASFKGGCTAGPTWRFKVGKKRLGFNRRAAPLAKGQNPHDPDLVGLGKGQNIPHRHAVAGLRASLTVQAQMPPQHHLGGKVTPFEETRLP